MEAGDALKEQILNGASTAELKMDAIRLGMRTLRQSAINKLMEGVTTTAEVARVSAVD
jgi:type IV pilus assembly protein PilB